MLVKVFSKLPRWDLERFQLVGRYFRDIIVKSSELSEKRGPLRPVDVTIGTGLQDEHFVTSVDDHRGFTCPDRDSLDKRLKFGTVRKLR